MYYGNNSASDRQNAADVWNSSYSGVWHLNQNSIIVKDSTATGNDCTNNGATYTSTGKIDGAYDFNNPNPDGYVIESNSYYYSFNSEITLEAWFKYTGPGNGSPRILEISKNGDANSHCLAVDSDASLRAWLECDTGTRIASVDDPTTYNDNQWHYMVYTYSNPNGKLYIDGSEKESTSDACSNLDDGSYLVIGAISDGSSKYATSDHEFDGFIDEVRISNSYKTPAWIAAQYLSMTDTFITFGAEEN